MLSINLLMFFAAIPLLFPLSSYLSYWLGDWGNALRMMLKPGISGRLLFYICIIIHYFLLAMQSIFYGDEYPY